MGIGTESTSHVSRLVDEGALAAGAILPSLVAAEDVTQIVPKILRCLSVLDLSTLKVILPSLPEPPDIAFGPSFFVEYGLILRSTLELFKSTGDAAQLCKLAEFTELAIEGGRFVPELTRQFPPLDSLIGSLALVSPAKSLALASSFIGAGGTVDSSTLLRIVSGSYRRGNWPELVRGIQSLAEKMASARRMHPNGLSNGVSGTECEFAGFEFDAALQSALNSPRSESRRASLSVFKEIACARLLNDLPLGQERNCPTTMGRFIVELQAMAPREAVELTTLAIQKGYSIRENTILFTIGAGLDAATCHADLVLLADLACTALDLGIVHPNGKTVKDKYNVLLAILCDPTLVSTRISPAYKPESSILDIGLRLREGLRVAESVARSSISFLDEENEGRMNATIRALASVACALNLEQIRMSENVDPVAMNDILAAIRFPFEFPKSRRNDDDVSHYISLSHHLLHGAIGLAHLSLGKAAVTSLTYVPTPRFNVNGSTINTLVTALEGSEYHITDLDAVRICQVFEKAVRIKQIRIKLFSESLNRLIQLIVTSPAATPLVKSLVSARIVTLPHQREIARGICEHVQALLQVVQDESPSSPSAVRSAQILMEKQGTARQQRKSPGKPQTMYRRPLKETPDSSRQPWFTQLLLEAKLSQSKR